MAKARAVAGLRPKATLLDNARKVIAVRVDELFSFAHAVGDMAHYEDFHNMRIAAKRLRYSMEMFRVCLTEDGVALIEVVKEIQERIGAIHDADVLAGLTRPHMAVATHRRLEALIAATGAGDEAARLASVRAIAAQPEPALGLAALLARVLAEHDAQHAAFTAWWEQHGGGSLRARLDACLRPDEKTDRG